MLGVLWTSAGVPVSMAGRSASILPAVDPLADGVKLADSTAQRYELANCYLRRWNDMLLGFFEFDINDISVRRVQATMSQYGRIFGKYDRGHLQQLLSVEYSGANHLHQIDQELYGSLEPNPASGDENGSILFSKYTLLATVYWGSMPRSLPGLFQDPTDSDAVAYAEARFFVPRPRLTWAPWPPTDAESHKIGGMPGAIQAEPYIAGTQGGPEAYRVLPEYHWYYTTWSPTVPPPAGYVESTLARLKLGPYRTVFGDRYGLSAAHARPDDWTLLNQNWTAAMVPATLPAWNEVLNSSPAAAGVAYSPPDASGLNGRNVQAISPH
jgi:hypothetical protein